MIVLAVIEQHLRDVLELGGEGRGGDGEEGEEGAAVVPDLVVFGVGAAGFAGELCAAGRGEG